ncbi:MAG TPA: 3-hydroxyacyl-ACP dehydratase FabZ [Candidatus Enterenecus merdae]|nr:3-hydroxyacyl-ACP dehydratase FabZ [Candidatus Enterenecus merdae]
MLQFQSNEIAAILPHRYPFALVDRIVDGEQGKWARGIKCVSVNEPFFQGHFPQYHVMPGVLIIEALAQVGAVAVLSLPEHRGKIGFLGAIRNARFRRQVTPGDVLELECTITRQKGPVAQAQARATVNGQEAVTAELTFALNKQEP